MFSLFSTSSTIISFGNCVSETINPIMAIFYRDNFKQDLSIFVIAHKYIIMCSRSHDYLTTGISAEIRSPWVLTMGCMLKFTSNTFIMTWASSRTCSLYTNLLYVDNGKQVLITYTYYSTSLRHERLINIGEEGASSAFYKLSAKQGSNCYHLNVGFSMKWLGIQLVTSCTRSVHSNGADSRVSRRSPERFNSYMHRSTHKWHWHHTFFCDKFHWET